MIFRWYRFVEWVEERADRARRRDKENRERLKQWHFHFALVPRGIYLPVPERLVDKYNPATDSSGPTKVTAVLPHVAWLTTIARRATYANSYKPNKKLYEYGPITNVVTQKDPSDG